MVGAVIQVDGTKKGATTDDNGDFEIKGVDKEVTLVVSFVGYGTRKISIGGRKDLAIALHIVSLEMAQVSVTVNTGYQSLPKERATGSFTQIDNATLNQQVGSNILDRLNGVTSGVLFDYSKIPSDQKKLNFNVRGLSTINGPQDPLIILDNFPYEGDLSNINPNIVESITVLKDAAAASIWGTRAGNGVIVITTKKGRFNQPVKIDFNSNIQVVQKPDLYSLPQMSSTDYIDVEEYLYNQGYFASTLSDGHSALTPVVDILYKRDNGLLTADQATAQIDAFRTHDVRSDFNKYFYRRAVNQQYGLNLYGGSGNISYIVSGGLDKNISELNAGYDRLNVRAENTYKPLKNLLIIAGITYTNSKSTSGRQLITVSR